MVTREGYQDVGNGVKNVVTSWHGSCRGRLYWLLTVHTRTCR